MERLLARLERKFGRWAIPNLTFYLVGFSVFVFVLELARPGFIDVLTLDVERVKQGEVWRLVSFLIIPRTMSMLWFIICVYFLVIVGNGLEARWGTFKLNVYYLVGIIGALGAAYVLRHGVSNWYLNASLVLAFATLFPDYPIMLFGILPLKAKWIGVLASIDLIEVMVNGTLVDRTATILAVSNYLLFCHRPLFEHSVALFHRGRRFKRQQEFAPPPRQTRYCKTCGVSDDDPAVDMRVCTCAKCGEPTNYCLEHARNH